MQKQLLKHLNGFHSEIDSSLQLKETKACAL